MFFVFFGKINSPFTIFIFMCTVFKSHDSGMSALFIVKLHVVKSLYKGNKVGLIDLICLNSDIKSDIYRRTFYNKYFSIKFQCWALKPPGFLSDSLNNYLFIGIPTLYMNVKAFLLPILVRVS